MNKNIIILATIAIILCSCTSKEKEANELCDKGWELIAKGNNQADTTLFDSANAIFDRALAIIPTAEAYAGKAKYYVRKNLEEAIVWANKSFAIDSVDNAKAFGVKGEIAREQEDYKLSFYYFQKQVEASKNDFDKTNAFRNIAASYYYLDETRKFLEYCEKAYELNPTDNGVMNNLAIAYTANGYYEKSNDIYDKIIALNSGKFINALVWGNKAANFNYLKMHPAALLCCKKALEMNPDEKAAIFLTGWTYYLSEQYDSALIWYDKMLQKDSTHLNALEHKGQAYQAMGLKYYPQAIVYYEKALRVAPEGKRTQELNDSIASIKRQMQ
ncbi:MAG: hypothetical protein LBO69_09420 [Ignavibacteria bacterium]|jgi:tetratricopeptide (TPR) repeat protein|nr:hypothetical protein [Ignavibacteria bacterium]